MVLFHASETPKAVCKSQVAADSEAEVSHLCLEGVRELFVHEMPFHLMALILDKLIQGHVDVQKDLTHSLVSSSASVGPLVGSAAHSAPAKLGFRTVNRM